MADLKTYAALAFETTLDGTLAAGATTVDVQSTGGSPPLPFYLVVDPGSDDKREVVLVDGSKTATSFTLSGMSSRGQDGTDDVEHGSGAVCAVVPVSAHINDLHDRVDNASTGELGYAEVTANQTGITTEVDLTGLSVTVTVETGRLVRVSAGGQLRWTSAADPNILMMIKQDGTRVQNIGKVRGPDTGGTAAERALAVEGSVRLAPSAGSHTYNVSLSADVATDVQASGFNPAFILVEDLGPA